MIYKTDLYNPKLVDTSKKIEDKNLIEFFLDTNKLTSLIDTIPKTPDRYVPLCKDAIKDDKCDQEKLKQILQKENFSQKDVIVNNINLILELLFDKKNSK